MKRCGAISRPSRNRHHEQRQAGPPHMEPKSKKLQPATESSASCKPPFPAERETQLVDKAVEIRYQYNSES